MPKAGERRDGKAKPLAKRPSNGVAKPAFKSKAPAGASKFAGKQPPNAAPAPRLSRYAMLVLGSSIDRGADSPLCRKDAKQAKLERFAAIKKNFSLIQDSVKIWELMRPKETAPEQKRALVNQVIGKVHGKILELSQHHTASRIIQFCAKFGSPEQRAAILAEVKASMVELAKGKHGHHLVQALIALSKKQDLAGLLAQFKGHVAELARHPCGADVLVDLYDVASTQQRNALCAEFYGREYVLFDGVATPAGELSGLRQLLAGIGAAKRQAIYLHLSKALMPVLEKAILHPPMVHRLVREFLECMPSSTVEDVVDTLTQGGTSVLKMVHTHDGAAAVCMLVAYGSAKDRKRLIKAMKGHVHDMATNEWGYAVLCTVFSVVDDSALVVKTVVPELKAMLQEAVEDQYAHRVLLQLLSPDNRHYLPQAVLEMMHPQQRTVMGSSGKMVTDLEGDEDEVDVHATSLGDAATNEEGDDEDLFAPSSSKQQQQQGEDGQAGGGKSGGRKGKAGRKTHRKREAKKEEGEDGIGVPSASGRGAAGGDGSDEEGAAAAPSNEPRVLGLSKKDKDTRRRELLGHGPSSLGALLAGLVAQHAGSLLRSPHGCNVVVEVARGGDGGLLAEVCPEGVARAQDALAAAVARSRDDDEGPESGLAEGEAGPAPQQEHVMVHYHASRALRRLVFSASEAGGGSSPAAQACVDKLWTLGLKGRCKEWVGTHGDKVLAALLHSGSDQVKKEAAKELQPLVPGKDLQAWLAPMVTKQAKHTKEKEGRHAPAAAGKAKAAAATAAAGKAKAAASTAAAGKAKAAASTAAAGKAKAAASTAAAGKAKAAAATAAAGKAKAAAATAAAEGAAAAGDKKKRKPAAEAGRGPPHRPREGPKGGARRESCCVWGEGQAACRQEGQALRRTKTQPTNSTVLTLTLTI